MRDEIQSFLDNRENAAGRNIYDVGQGDGSNIGVQKEEGNQFSIRESSSAAHMVSGVIGIVYADDIRPVKNQAYLYNFEKRKIEDGVYEVVIEVADSSGDRVFFELINPKGIGLKWEDYEGHIEGRTGTETRTFAHYWTSEDDSERDPSDDDEELIGEPPNMDRVPTVVLIGALALLLLFLFGGGDGE